MLKNYDAAVDCRVAICLALRPPASGPQAERDVYVAIKRILGLWGPSGTSIRGLLIAVRECTERLLRK